MGDIQALARRKGQVCRGTYIWMCPEGTLVSQCYVKSVVFVYDLEMQVRIFT